MAALGTSFKTLATVHLNHKESSKARALDSILNQRLSAASAVVEDDGWEVMDAEMYAIFRAIKRVILESRSKGMDAREQRLLILTDCSSAIEILEQAWRREPTCA